MNKYHTSKKDRDNESLQKAFAIFFLTIICFCPVSSAEVANKPMFDSQAFSTHASPVASTADWQPAKLPEGVIPAIEPIRVPRNEKVRIMKNIPKIMKVHPVVKKTQSSVVVPVVNTIPKVYDTPAKTLPKLAPKISTSE